MGDISKYRQYRHTREDDTVGGVAGQFQELGVSDAVGVDDFLFKTQLFGIFGDDGRAGVSAPA